MARAGVSYTVTREANSRAGYNETLNGIQLFEIPTLQWGPYGTNGRRKDGRGLWDRSIPLDPYVRERGGEARKRAVAPRTARSPGPDRRRGTGRPGLLLSTLPDDPRGEPAADRAPPRVITPHATSWSRYIRACLDAGDAIDLRWFTKFDPLPNEKFDFNTAYFGLNDDNENKEQLPGGIPRRAHGDPDRARALCAQVCSTSLPPMNACRRTSDARSGVRPLQGRVHRQRWLAAPAFVRKARRMVSDLVMTEHHCRGKQDAPKPIGLAWSGIDIHEVRRIAHNGLVVREGKLLGHSGTKGPYPVGYGAIVPKASEAVNLLVPFCLSASHVAFGSIRMEPVFMILSQSAATAACLAIDGKVSVQDVDYPALRVRLLADDQILARATSSSPPSLSVPKAPGGAANAATRFDLVVVGGTPGGVACTVRGAEGLKVLLVNHTRHLGGMLTNGLCQWDDPTTGRGLRSLTSMSAPSGALPHDLRRDLAAVRLRRLHDGEVPARHLRALGCRAEDRRACRRRIADHDTAGILPVGRRTEGSTGRNGDIPPAGCRSRALRRGHGQGRSVRRRHI